VAGNEEAAPAKQLESTSDDAFVGAVDAAWFALPGFRLRRDGFAGHMRVAN